MPPLPFLFRRFIHLRTSCSAEPFASLFYHRTLVFAREMQKSQPPGKEVGIFQHLQDNSSREILRHLFYVFIALSGDENQTG